MNRESARVGSASPNEALLLSGREVGPGRGVTPMRTLVAGFGNELRGDDGFGIAVLQGLEPTLAERPDVDLLEVGTGGLALAQTLLDPYDRLIVVDAMTRGGAPGSLYVLLVDSVDEIRDVDLHLATPERALSVAQALGGLPDEVYLVGCEPSEVDELTMELSEPVSAAVARGITAVLDLLPVDEAPPVHDPQKRIHG